MASDSISRHPKLRGRTGRVERNCGIWKAAARMAIKYGGARGFVENAKTRASMVTLAKNARINSLAQWAIGRGCNLSRSLLDDKQSGELTSLQLPDHSPEIGRRMSRLWAASRAFETMVTGHRL